MIMRKKIAILVATTVILVIQVVSVSHGDTPKAVLWEALRSANHFALVRHALAPGTGDPTDFMLGVRRTQRNLSVEGRNQAKQMGELFQSNSISEAQVFSSQWFRCMDTAELLDLGSVQPLTALNSFFREYELKDARTKSLRDWLFRQNMEKPLILVTHQVNITALTGIFPSSGEIVVMQRSERGDLFVLGTIETR